MAIPDNIDTKDEQLINYIVGGTILWNTIQVWSIPSLNNFTKVYHHV